MAFVSPVDPFPLKFSSPETFAAARAFLAASDFSAATLCRVLNIAQMSELRAVDWDRVAPDALGPALRWCVEALARGRRVSAAESAAVCGDQVLAAFIALGLLRPAKDDPASLVCPAWVYPVDGFVVASDRTDDPDGGVFHPGADVVFPAIYAGTLRFLDLLPDARGGDALDLCGGSGIGALHLARTARAAATADIAERAALFADFNARLNGVACASWCGDLYEPAAGRQFDLITAHPPFVPATGPAMVYRDGGDTGESIIRRIIEGLPASLRPGGVGVVLCVARDTDEGTYEVRARQWLGAAGAAFDLVYGLEKILTVDEVVASLRDRGRNLNAEQAGQLLERLRTSGTRQFVYGVLFLRRHHSAVPEPPVRVRLTAEGRSTDFARLLAWRQHCRRPDFTAWLAAARPRLAPGLHLEAHHVVQDGGLVPAEFIFSIAGGFQSGLRPDGWIVPVLAGLNGQRTAHEVFATARAAGRLPEKFPLEAFLDLLRAMIAQGMLEVDFPP